jgi:enoyl-[acyl-carrier protein] reductase II
MGTRFAITSESPLPLSVKNAIIQSTENDTIYGSNFDGIPARVLRTTLSLDLMKKRPFIGIILYRAIMAAQTMKIPLWKIIPGLFTQFTQIFMIAQFGAASEKLMQATIHGNLQNGIQFIGQSQGLIHDIPTVDELVQRIVLEAKDITLQNAKIFQQDDSQVIER